MLIARGVRRLALIAVAITVALCAQAQAASTIGAAQPRTGAGCDFNGTYVQTASPGDTYKAPHDGVITSWTSRGAWPSATLKMVRLGAAGSYTVVGSDGPRTYVGDGNTSHTYPVRIPVRQGDALGVHHAGPGYCIPSSADHTTGTDDANLSAGATSTFDNFSQGSRVPIEASLDRDRDGDGFGDETQDECPTNPGTQGPCPLPTTLGRTFTPLNPPQTLTGFSVRPFDHRFTAPADGIITSWSYAASQSVAGTAKLKTIRAEGGDGFRVVAESEAKTPTANTLNTFAARVPIREGDRIGISVANLPLYSSAGDGGSSRAGPPDLAPGASATFSQGARTVNVSAVLEADADNDGFGDTSQDQCPTDASTQAACAVPPPGGDDACDKARKKLAKAKAKLKQLKQKNAAAQKIKKAKKKVKKAKAAVRKAC